MWIHQKGINTHTQSRARKVTTGYRQNPGGLLVGEWQVALMTLVDLPSLRPRSHIPSLKPSLPFKASKRHIS